MVGIPGIHHLAAVRALERAGFRVVRQGKHIVMSDGTHQVTIPRTIRSRRSHWAELSETRD